MFDDDFRSVGEIAQSILDRLACASHTVGNVVSFEMWKAAHPRPLKINAMENQARAVSGSPAK